MFSYEDRCIYRRSPLIEVICQLRFPAILRIDAQAPAQFQEAIRGDYPQFSQRMENLPPRKEGGKLVPQGTQPNYQFLAKDNHWKVNLTKNFISLSTNHYTRWEDFAKRLDKVLAAFIRLYQPTYFERVGLRFINSISRRALELEGAQWRELLQPGFLGLLAEPDMKEQGVMGEGQPGEDPVRPGDDAAEGPAHTAGAAGGRVYPGPGYLYERPGRSAPRRRRTADGAPAGRQHLPRGHHACTARGYGPDAAVTRDENRTYNAQRRWGNPGGAAFCG